jgi:hypothetical protein
VSRHSEKIIGNFLAHSCCYSSQAPDNEEPEVNTKNLEKMPALSLSLDALHASLQEMTQKIDLGGGGAAGQIRKDVHSGCLLADRLWNLKDLQGRLFARTFTLRGHIDANPDDEDAEDERNTGHTSACKTQPRSSIRVGIATRIEIAVWLQAIQREDKPPGVQQLQLLRMIFERCWIEAREIRSSSINTTDAEPLRHMIQGLPGAGKSELIKWICRGFEEIFGFQHGVQYVCLASQNTMAALINGFTNHSWGGVPVTRAQFDQWQNTNWNTPQVSPLFEKNQHMRWILIDEGSTTSAEVFGIVESNVTRSTRSTGTWKIREGSRNQERPFGGCNLLFFVDWWQLPPVKSTDLKATPYPEKSASPMVQKAMTFFWNRSIDSFTGMTELTHSYRQALDPWFSEFLEQCRHGRLSWSMYFFFHGLPTLMPGSWMPTQDGPGELLCKSAACQKLWDSDWLEMRRTFASFAEMQMLECDVCKSIRADRCRVRQSDKADARHTESPFTEAPYVVPYNLPKYFAQQLRALQFAQNAQPPQQLLWIVARDMPFLGDIKRLKGAELSKREAQWLQKHDQATNGIMGFFPATLNEPVRFTATQSKQLRIFKNTRGVLVNWELHPVDVALLQGEQSQEIILKQTPRKLYVQIPGATWQYSQSLPPGVYPLKPVFRPWHLDKAGNNRIRRFGYQLVPDFSGTAHSYVGYTLKAALADCLSWDNTPTRDHMLRSYCTMSRTCTAKTLLVMQPFAPMLFRQGELAGPHLMMEFWHGRLAAEDVKAAWKSAETSQGKAKNRLEDILWPCSMCKKDLESSCYGVAQKRDHRFLAHYWQRIMVPGEWRVCMNCKGTLRGAAFTDYECRACHQELPVDRFDAERLKTWRQQKNYEQIICLRCEPLWSMQWWEKRVDRNNYTCRICSKALPKIAYGAEGFSRQEGITCMECDRPAVVQQKKLDHKKFNCSGPCERRQLSHLEFTAAMLLHKDAQKWLCKICQFPKCAQCGLPSSAPLTRDDYTRAGKCKRTWTCQLCLYPPCAGCGLERSRLDKRKSVQLKLWYCPKCRGREIAKTTQKHPPCSGCGAKKAKAVQEPKHAHRPWRCSSCWRKADSKSA